MLTRLFGGKKAQDATANAAAAPRYAPGTRVSYDPKLIGHFESHHKVLLDLFGKMMAAADAKDYNGIRVHMERFRKNLNAHLLEERVKLYSYLGGLLASDAQNNQVMMSMRKEMSDIGTEVFRFIEHYTENGVDENSLAAFKQRLGEIGNILIDRIGREERVLYRLYTAPPDAV